MTLDIINNTINSRQFNTFSWYMYVLNESYVQMWLSRKGNDMAALDCSGCSISPYRDKKTSLGFILSVQLHVLQFNLQSWYKLPN